MDDINIRRPEPGHTAESVSELLPALRAYEAELRQLLACDPLPEEELRSKASEALMAAKACARGGAFSLASPADLAGIVDNFANMRSFPVTEKIDAILELVAQEIVIRGSQEP